VTLHLLSLRYTVSHDGQESPHPTHLESLDRGDHSEATGR
jgi:hypothetical protein